VVSVTDPSGRISRFSRQEPPLFNQVAPQFVFTRLRHIFGHLKSIQFSNSVKKIYDIAYLTPHSKINCCSDKDISL
jgi:hypothetical protein